MRQRRKLVALLVLGMLTVIDTVIVSLAVAPASASKHWPGVLDYVRIHPWQAIAVTTIAGAGMSALTLMLARDSPEEVGLGLMAVELAGAVESNWLYETARWRVLDPYPLPVGWLPAEPALVASWGDITLMARGWPAAWRSGADGWIAGPSGLAGGADDLADVLGRIPTGRLVVLGDRGAGKTILLARTVLGMLSRRGKGGPVPILLPMASWNPGEQGLLDWMAQWMATTWAPLARPARPGSETSIARALLDASLIVPILDGLDEVSRDFESLAIDRLNSASGHIRGLIVSCRTAAFAAAVRPAPGLEVLLAGAAGSSCPRSRTPTSPITCRPPLAARSARPAGNRSSQP